MHDTGPTIERASPRGLGRLLLVLFGVAAAEAALQAACLISPDVAAKLSGFKPRYVADSVLDVRGDSSLAEYDDRGFRNAARPARAAVVVIGDSQTEGAGVSREHAWPQRLAALTGLNVYQMAFGGYGPGHYFTLLDPGLAFQPGTVLVAFYAGNDLPSAYDWVYTAHRSPELRAEDSTVLAAFYQAEQQRGALDQTWEITNDARKDLANSPGLVWLKDNIFRKSKLVFLGKQIAWRVRHGAAELEPDRDDGNWDEIRSRADESQGGLLLAFEADAVRTVLTPPARLSALDTADPRIAEGLRITIAALKEMAARCAGKARFAVIDIPTKELVYADVVRARTSALPLAYQALVVRETFVHGEIRRALESAGIQRLDALPVLRAVLASGRNPYFMDWDGHPNALGQDAIAAAVAALIKTEDVPAAAAPAPAASAAAIPKPAAAHSR